MEFADRERNMFKGYSMYAALFYDNGKAWQICSRETYDMYSEQPVTLSVLLGLVGKINH